MNNIPKKIRDDSLWQDVYKLVQKIYSQIDTLVVDFPDEQWTTASKLRNSANDGFFNVSQVVGSASSEMDKYDLNAARKNIFSLQAMYMLAAKNKFLVLQPELVVSMDAILAEIDIRIAASDREIELQRQKELEPWMQKYKLWQKMQD